MQRLYKSRDRRGRRRATIKRADAEAMQIKGRRGRRKLTITKADVEAIQIKGPQREAKGDNKAVLGDHRVGVL